jgi:hypothetical protein
VREVGGGCVFYCPAVNNVGGVQAKPDKSSRVETGNGPIPPDPLQRSVRARTDKGSSELRDRNRGSE